MPVISVSIVMDEAGKTTGPPILKIHIVVHTCLHSDITDTAQFRSTRKPCPHAAHFLSEILTLRTPNNLIIQAATAATDNFDLTFLLRTLRKENEMCGFGFFYSIRMIRDCR